MNTVYPPLPLLPPEDQALLSRYLSLNEDLAALAREQDGKHDLLSLLQWLSRAEIAAYITAFHTHLNHLHRQAIITALRTALAAQTDPIEIRRAAATLLRALNPRPSSPTGGGAGAAGGGGSVSTTSTKPPHSENTTSNPESSENRRLSAGLVSPPSTHLPRPPRPPRSAHASAQPPRHQSHESHESHSPSERAIAASPTHSAAPVPAPLPSSSLHTPPNHSSTLAQALALLGLPTDLEELDRLDDEEDDAADDAELDAYADGEDEYDDEDEHDDFTQDPTNPPHPTNSS